MLHIVGGSYHEICRDPFWNELYGSGFRAAVGLAALEHPITFHTYADDKTRNVISLLSTQLQFTVDFYPVSESPVFGYQHPLSTPLLYPQQSFYSDVHPIKLESAENVLCFGMIEGNAIIHANRAVYDPQNPDNPTLFHTNGSTVKELVYILNLSEATKIASSSEIEEIKDFLFKDINCKAAVIKNGPEGATLLQRDASEEHIPVYITESVWPIGSGDIFSAAFAYNWLVNGISLRESAIKASLATAYYANSKSLNIQVDLPEATFKPLPRYNYSQSTVYIAGPFFNMAQRWLVNQVRDAFLKMGIDTFSPFHDVGIGGPNEVTAPDLEGLERSSVVFAILDGLDSGTLFEIGYACSLNLPVVCLCESEPKESLTMLIGSGCDITNDFTTAIYKTVWKCQQRL